MFKSLRPFLQLAQIGQARSSVINPLQWTLVILMFAVLALVIAHGPDWLLKFFAITLAVVLALLIFAYLYFMFKNPDALRSENYSLVKTAIEKRVVGDSLTGLREIVDTFEGGGSGKLLKIGTGEDSVDFEHE